MSPQTPSATATGTPTPAAASAATIRTRDALIALGAAILALIALYAVFVDNGQLVSATGGYLHEFSHDGRHLFGAPCH
ncbi:CbtB domain-containing protein [Streptomyces boncukensis]|uniref:CbtB-domain containing protein n=1 Tax=Streptomyces boncukensis TaxID=2711219 RepID=A0A6G4WUA9_9ACTN|nr:CbtB-domain containing protein [Streptomyces boncukensis]NGO68869.1 CbtB-domain containing protein [Streptomyces boncukensis]